MGQVAPKSRSTAFLRGLVRGFCPCSASRTPRVQVIRHGLGGPPLCKPSFSVAYRRRRGRRRPERAAGLSAPCTAAMLSLARARAGRPVHPGRGHGRPAAGRRSAVVFSFIPARRASDQGGEAPGDAGWEREARAEGRLRPVGAGGAKPQEAAQFFVQARGLSTAWGCQLPAKN